MKKVAVVEWGLVLIIDVYIMSFYGKRMSYSKKRPSSLAFDNTNNAGGEYLFEKTFKLPDPSNLEIRVSEYNRAVSVALRKNGGKYWVPLTETEWEDLHQEKNRSRVEKTIDECKSCIKKYRKGGLNFGEDVQEAEVLTQSDKSKELLKRQKAHKKWKLQLEAELNQHAPSDSDEESAEEDGEVIVKKRKKRNTKPKKIATDDEVVIPPQN